MIPLLTVLLISVLVTLNMYIQFKTQLFEKWTDLAKFVVHTCTHHQGDPGDALVLFRVPRRRRGVPLKDADAKHKILIASLISDFLGERVRASFSMYVS